MFTSYDIINLSLEVSGLIKSLQYILTRQKLEKELAYLYMMEPCI
jgi:hypothetical protein